MLVFNNQQQSGYFEIVSHSPKYYKQIKEMDAIYQFAGWTTDIISEDLEQLISIQFVMNMTDEQIRMYEKMCQIVSTESMTLDQRRSNVYSYLFGNGKISGSKLAAIISIMFGENTEVNIKMEDMLEISIMTVNNNDDVIHEKLLNFLDRVLPAHLAQSVIYEEYLQGKTFNGILWHDIEIVEIRQVVL